MHCEICGYDAAVLMHAENYVTRETKYICHHCQEDNTWHPVGWRHIWEDHLRHGVMHQDGDKIIWRRN